MRRLLNDGERLALLIPEVARRLGRTEIATRRAIERGQLPARRWGRRVIVLADELEAYLRALPRVAS
jgi:excisionase family DNA binding protein